MIKVAPKGNKDTDGHPFLCGCFPEFITERAMSGPFDPKNTRCAMCKILIDPKDFISTQAVAYKCRRKSGIIHVVRFITCLDKCTDELDKGLEKLHGWALATEDFHKVDPKNCPPVVKEFLKKHGLGVIECDHCGNHQILSEPKFGHCGACKKVSYCSKKCQTAGWEKHKELCKQSRGLATGTTVDQVSGKLGKLKLDASKIEEHKERLKELGMELADKPCKCFDNEALHRLKAGVNHCAYLGCTKPLENTCALQPIVMMCSDGGDGHLFINGYCCESHRRKGNLKARVITLDQ